MATTKTLVCLANSDKNQERCVAGVELGGSGSGDWVRPVSARGSGAVSAVERMYADGSDPRVLDIIRVPLIGSRPSGFQRENWLLDHTGRWQKVGRLGWVGLSVLEQRPGKLWINGYGTYHGLNNFVPEEQAATLADSLKLIRVNRLRLQVRTSLDNFGNSRLVVDAHFLYANWTYALRVTDPRYKDVYLRKGEGTYQLGESFLTVSLAEPYKGGCYKLVAAIIERETTGTSGEGWG